MPTEVSESKFIELYMQALGNKTFENNAKALLRSLEINVYIKIDSNSL
jgi:hypothetical protein